MAAQESSQFGRGLRRLRESAGLTQEGLAERAGLSVQAVAALESGRRQRPHTHTVKALADALGLSERKRAELEAVVPGRETPADLAPSESTSIPTSVRLPLQPTGLIGRERDMVTLRPLLRSGARIVTLTGPGGVGKTRLAVEVARDLSEGYPDGVAFVGLAPLSDAGLVIPTMAHALGLREVGGEVLHDTLRTYLREKQMLLVLDNFEQVLGAASDVAGLVISCPSLTVLVTSRAPLRVRGEREYAVGSLTLPELSRIPAPTDAARSDAVRLFVERARDVLPAFELTRANAAAVAAICRRLEGLPLALELAAARVRTLSPTELLARLDHSLPLLAGGARDMPERQRTMRGAIEWSYQLLEEPQRMLLNRLSAFRGGWELEAAEAVGAGEGIPEQEVLDLLTGLVEQSLVVVETREDGRTRYRLLVPVREYAEERLIQSGEAEETRRRHAEYFLALAEEAEAELAGPKQVNWLERLETENDNLRAVLGWTLDGAADGSLEQTERALQMAGALWRFWEARGYLAEGHKWLESALAASEGRDLSARAKALIGAGWIGTWSGASG